eukprot:1203290-Amorphochlora_amoeboformis.AAC.1
MLRCIQIAPNKHITEVAGCGRIGYQDGKITQNPPSFGFSRWLKKARLLPCKRVVFMLLGREQHVQHVYGQDVCP